VATALVALQRWGRRTAYVGTFGDGDAGRLARASLVAEGVDVGAARVRPGVSNQLAFILVDRDSGERTILMHRPAALTLRPDELDRALVTAGRVLHLDGYDLDAAVQAAGWARAAGIPVVVDVDAAVAGIDRLLAHADAVAVSREFASRVTGCDDEERALARLAGETGAPLTAITLGRDGVIARAGGRTLRVPAYPVHAVDTTGAGDVFHAGLIHGLLAGWLLDATLRFANAAAGLKCTRVGGRPGIPTAAAAAALARS
jgi:sugar/nucleoside kinase (ribokinase family)